MHQPARVAVVISSTIQIIFLVSLVCNGNQITAIGVQAGVSFLQHCVCFEISISRSANC